MQAPTRPGHAGRAAWRPVPAAGAERKAGGQEPRRGRRNEPKLGEHQEGRVPEARSGRRDADVRTAEFRADGASALGPPGQFNGPVLGTWATVRLATSGAQACIPAA